jgi:hypothetical protein
VTQGTAGTGIRTENGVFDSALFGRDTAHVKQRRCSMGLAEDLKALQELRVKGELSESAYTAARDAALAKQAPPAKAKLIIRKATKIFLAVVILVAGFAIVMGIYDNARTGQIASVFRQPFTVTDEVQNVPAASWKALPYSFPTGGKVDITIRVLDGNPMDIFLTNADQLDAMKRAQWGNVRAYANFNATKTRTYHRTESVGPGSYCLVLRDTSLGVFSARTSHVSVKTILTP